MRDVVGLVVRGGMVCEYTKRWAGWAGGRRDGRMDEWTDGRTGTRSAFSLGIYWNILSMVVTSFHFLGRCTI